MESEKSSEFRERGSVFKQMAEMKKKIQLVEGERKAIFEDCESEKQTNKDKIKKMKDEVKFLQADHLAANRTSENILKTVGSEKKVVGAQVLKKKSGDDAVQVMDYKVADLRKKTQ